jgi:hypothetical protein
VVVWVVVVVVLLLRSVSCCDVIFDLAVTEDRSEVTEFSDHLRSFSGEEVLEPSSSSAGSSSVLPRARGVAEGAAYPSD